MRAISAFENPFGFISRSVWREERQKLEVGDGGNVETVAMVQGEITRNSTRATIVVLRKEAELGATAGGSPVAWQVTPEIKRESPSFPAGPVVKNPLRHDTSSIPGPGRSNMPQGD